MKTYRISNQVSGADLGTYEALDADAALALMARAAGYRDYAACCIEVPAEAGELRVRSVDADVA